MGRKFDKLCSDDSQVAMDLPSKMDWILMKNWKMEIRRMKDRTCEKDDLCLAGNKKRVLNLNICNQIHNLANCKTNFLMSAM